MTLLVEGFGQKTEVLSQPKYPNIEAFNRLWEAKLITTPLYIMVGGYAGVGKSTVVEGLRSEIKYLSPYATGFARAAAQSFIPREQNPALYESTFKLHTIMDGEYSGEKIWRLFLDQRAPVEQVLAKCSGFVASEHQHTVIDGNHTSPKLAEMVAFERGVYPIDIYLKVSDPIKHLEMLQGPTHSRKLSNDDFRTAREIHDRMVEEAMLAGKPVFEYTNALQHTLEHMDAFLGEIVSSI